MIWVNINPPAKNIHERQFSVYAGMAKNDLYGRTANRNSSYSHFRALELGLFSKEDMRHYELLNSPKASSKLILAQNGGRKRTAISGHDNPIFDVTYQEGPMDIVAISISNLVANYIYSLFFGFDFVDNDTYTKMQEKGTITKFMTLKYGDILSMLESLFIEAFDAEINNTPEKIRFFRSPYFNKSGNDSLLSNMRRYMKGYCSGLKQI